MAQNYEKFEQIMKIFEQIRKLSKCDPLMIHILQVFKTGMTE